MKFKEDNLLEMSDENITQLSPMRTTYSLCTCENEGGIVNEANCSIEKTIPCDIIPTKLYQKNICFAKRRRQSLKTRLAYIPNNFVQNHGRRKAGRSHKYKIFINKTNKLYILYSIFINCMY